tara:strand:+ start:917 stop:1948 length:1032 start_codon:yes stop_codon:yes gene_type:complete
MSELLDLGLFPLDRPLEQEALEDYIALQSKSCVSLFVEKDWKSRSELDDSWVLPYVLKRSNVGNKSSDYFHWATRMACDSAVSPSPIRSWYDRKIRKSVENSIYYEDNPRTALAMRKYIPPQFRPSAAKAIYELFNTQRVYDPCGGWGDRMAGAMACGVNHYHCRDVNPLVFSGYALQQKMLTTTTNVTFEYRGAEIDPPADEWFDLVFTSPPYYKIEKYHGDKQSFRQYKKCDEWIEKFLLEMVNHSWQSLTSKGFMLINISDCYVDHRYNKLCKPLVAHCLEKLDDCHLMGVIGYEIGSRMGRRVQSGVNAEPIFIFEKGNKTDFAKLLPQEQLNIERKTL